MKQHISLGMLLALAALLAGIHALAVDELLNIGRITLLYVFATGLLAAFLALFLLLRLNRWLFLSGACLASLYETALHQYVVHFDRPLQPLQVLPLLHSFATMLTSRDFNLHVPSLLLLAGGSCLALSFAAFHVAPPALPTHLLVPVGLTLLLGFTLPILAGKVNPSRLRLNNALFKYYGSIPFLFTSSFAERSATAPVDHAHTIRFTPAPASHHALRMLLLQVESLDTDLIHANVRNVPVMPFLASLTGAHDTFFAPRCISTHGLGGTSDVDYSVINGLMPPDTCFCMEFSEYPNSFFLKIPRRYATMIFHGNTGGFFNRADAFRRMGCAEFFDLRRMKLPESGWGASDRDVLAYAAQHLKRHPGPFIAYIITMTSHMPFTNYKYCRDYRPVVFSGQKRENDLLNSFHYVDACIRSFWREMLSAFPDIVIFIYGDHPSGTAFCNAAGLRMRSPGAACDFVPLFLRAPGRACRIAAPDGIVSQLDITPTILGLSGYEGDYCGDGRNLLEDVPPHAGVNPGGAGCPRGSLSEPEGPGDPAHGR